MDIQNLVRDRIIGNIKTGKKGPHGIPQKLDHFYVEEDKGTEKKMVDIFKQLYPDKPTKLQIRFTSENPFNFKFKRYVNGKAACIGNGTKAITVGKDSKGNNSQIEIDCKEECEHRQSGRCKLKGSLKFELIGIKAGGLWNLNTSGGLSLSNIASEIVKYKKAGMSIVGVPFELSLTEQQSLAYGTYYSIDLRRSDIMPQLDTEVPQLTEKIDSTPKQIQETKTLKEPQKEESKENEKDKTEKKNEKTTKKQEKNDKKVEEKQQQDYSNYMVAKKFLPTVLNGQKFDKIIFEDFNGQDVEYILHPKASTDIIKYGVGTLIEIQSSKMEANMNVLCVYKVKQYIDSEGKTVEINNEELKEAV